MTRQNNHGAVCHGTHPGCRSVPHSPTDPGTDSDSAWYGDSGSPCDGMRTGHHARCPARPAAYGNHPMSTDNSLP